ncbi:DUF2975 domain-containing protein [Aquimarina sp. 2201CG1-2-11]|uniref:DUF2975 domain-containing protein n=1 Tax=Aquimarina discodermiae TaxID=3231043 RepID=UPI0034627952
MKLKIFGKKSLSQLLFYITRLTTIGYSIFLLFISYAFVSDNFIGVSNGQFQIGIPLTDSAIKGGYDSSTIGSIIVFFIFYILFFYILSMVFRTFREEVLFTELAIKYLTYFAIINLFFPFVYGVLQSIILYKIDFNDLSIAFLHIILGVFSMFIITIFKQGVQLQEETELTI